MHKSLTNFNKIITLIQKDRLLQYFYDILITAVKHEYQIKHMLDQRPGDDLT